MKYRNSERAVNIVICILVIMTGAIVIYPIWYVLIASVSSPVAISSGEVLLLPKGLNFGAYRRLLENKLIWMGYRNSIFYTFAGTVVDLLVQIPCAYALSRRSLPGRRWLMFLFLFTMYFGGGMVPKYLLLNSLGMINSPIALIIPGCVSVYNIIVARNFFESSIPDSLFDAARIDGCGYTRFFLTIVIPLSPAILAIIALYCIQTHWNVYLDAQMYIYTPQYYTLQQVISSITANLDSSLVENLSAEEFAAIIQEKQLIKYAVVVVSCIPLVIIYPFIQKFFVRGVMIGAVKG